jgi:hypothetical protein
MLLMVGRWTGFGRMGVNSGAEVVVVKGGDVTAGGLEGWKGGHFFREVEGSSLHHHQ